jgi:hypothetical protein
MSNCHYAVIFEEFGRETDPSNSTNVLVYDFADYDTTYVILKKLNYMALRLH